MNKILGIALIAGGTMLLVNGFRAKESLESKASQALRGTPSKPAILMLAGGATFAAAGVALILLKK